MLFLVFRTCRTMNPGGGLGGLSGKSAPSSNGIIGGERRAPDVMGRRLYNKPLVGSAKTAHYPNFDLAEDADWETIRQAVLALARRHQRDARRFPQQISVVTSSKHHPQRTGDVILTIVKKAEEDDALIFRLYEFAGIPTQALLHLQGIAVRPFETNLMEKQRRSLPVAAHGRELVISIGP